MFGRSCHSSMTEQNHSSPKDHFFLLQSCLAPRLFECWGPSVKTPTAQGTCTTGLETQREGTLSQDPPSALKLIALYHFIPIIFVGALRTTRSTFEQFFPCCFHIPIVSDLGLQRPLVLWASHWGLTCWLYCPSGSLWVWGFLMYRALLINDSFMNDCL